MQHSAAGITAGPAPARPGRWLPTMLANDQNNSPALPVEASRFRSNGPAAGSALRPMPAARGQQATTLQHVPTTAFSRSTRHLETDRPEAQ